ncbi:hypothetical protein CF326_g9403 [Tilletia indica]|uniref:Uncharacterized protein n=1 Tax=Tilletia indica TaxID=43049 RepID=A0A177SZ57_9BASI|nr:hypothetical protein CF326_g9403 [Tilletia indica]KAE8237066.1 hypothetical protein A4X13_0g8926 [Tilletia indica]
MLLVVHAVIKFCVGIRIGNVGYRRAAGIQCPCFGAQYGRASGMDKANNKQVPSRPESPRLASAQTRSVPVTSLSSASTTHVCACDANVAIFGQARTSDTASMANGTCASPATAAAWHQRQVSQLSAASAFGDTTSRTSQDLSATRGGRLVSPVSPPANDQHRERAYIPTTRPEHAWLSASMTGQRSASRCHGFAVHHEQRVCQHMGRSIVG